MKKNTATSSRPRMHKGILLGLAPLCVAGAFAAGVRTSGNVQTVQTTEANDVVITGDMNDDQVVTIEDALIILEIAQGYESATPDQLVRDPNGNGQLTVEDAMRILQDLSQTATR